MNGRSCRKTRCHRPGPPRSHRGHGSHWCHGWRMHCLVTNMKNLVLYNIFFIIFHYFSWEKNADICRHGMCLFHPISYLPFSTPLKFERPFQFAEIRRNLPDNCSNPGVHRPAWSNRYRLLSLESRQVDMDSMVAQILWQQYHLSILMRNAWLVEWWWNSNDYE